MKRVLPGVLLALTASVHAADPAASCASLANATGAEPAGYAERCQGGQPLLPAAKASVLQRQALDDERVAYAVQMTEVENSIPTGLYQFPLTDFANATRVGTTDQPFSIHAMDFNPAGNQLFAAQVFANGLNLVGPLSTTTGEFTGFLTDFSNSGYNLTGLAIHPRTGEAWVTTNRRLTNNPPMSESHLWRFGLYDGGIAEVGRLFPEEADAVVIDIAINCQGQMYAHNISDDSLYHINPNDLATTLVGSHGLPANFAQGMAFDRRDDTLYGWIYTGGGNNTFGILDTQTGALQPLSENNPRGEWIGAIPGRCTAIPIADPAVLNGAWYARYSSGQGFTIRYYEHVGRLFMPFYTYTPAPEEVPDDSDMTEFQRWFVLEGSVQPGDTQAELIIAEVTGGSFDEVQPVTRVRAGEARLSMLSCDEAVLDYSFDEGFNDGVSGAISLTRLANTPLGVNCNDANGVVRPAQASYDPAFTGTWYDPQTDGQGLEIYRIAPDEDDEQDTGSFFGAWFTFDPESELTTAEGQHWFTLQNVRVDEDDDEILVASIIQSVGGSFDGNPAQFSGLVGTARLTPVSCSRLELAYEFNETTTAGAFKELEGVIELHRLGNCPADAGE